MRTENCCIVQRKPFAVEAVVGLLPVSQNVQIGLCLEMQAHRVAVPHIAGDASDSGGLGTALSLFIPPYGSMGILNNYGRPME